MTKLVYDCITKDGEVFRTTSFATANEVKQNAGKVETKYIDLERKLTHTAYKDGKTYRNVSLNKALTIQGEGGYFTSEYVTAERG